MVRLSARIRPTAVTLEHVPKALSPNSTISSAPKDFAIFVSICPVVGPEGLQEDPVGLSTEDQVKVTLGLGGRGVDLEGRSQGGRQRFSLCYLRLWRQKLAQES